MNIQLFARLLLSFILLSSVFLACKKEDIDNTDKDYPIQLTLSQPDRNIHLEWTQTNHSQFESYQIVRSTEPIPDNPTPAGVVGTVDEQDKPHFEDESFPLFDKVYYKVYVKIGERFLFSPTVSIELDVNLLDINPVRICHDPDGDRIFFFDNSQLKVVSYSYATDEITGTLSVPNSFNVLMAAGDNGSGQELYLSQNNASKLEIYDAETLEQKTSFLANSNILALASSNAGFIYVGTDHWNDRMVVYKRSNFANVNGEPFASFSSRNMAVLPNSGGLELLDVAFDKIDYYRFNANGTTAEHKEGFFFFNLIQGVAVSPDGELFVCSSEGTVFTKDLQSKGIIANPNFTFFNDFVFSPDGEELFGITGFPSELRTFSRESLQNTDTRPLNYQPIRLFADGNTLLVVGIVSNGFFIKTIVDEIPLN